MAIRRTRPDLGLRLEPESPEPIYRQIRRQIAEGIASGDLSPGFRLPPERTLARALGVNRSTVLAAYRDLKADGLIEGHVGRGTQVLSIEQRIAAGVSVGVAAAMGGAAPALGTFAAIPSAHTAPFTGRFGAGVEHAFAGTLPFAWEPIARSGPAMSDPLLRDLLDLERPGVISLALGLPGRELLPLDDLREVLEQVLAEEGPDALLHSPTEGTPALRRAAAAWMSERGAHCLPTQVLITTGSQQGLDLVSRVFLAPDDVVVMEEPGYLGAILTFRRASARIVSVPVDRDGMRLDILERVLVRRHPKLIYTVPTFQNPTGSEMSLERRTHLLELARRYQTPVLEEDPYSELRYEGKAIPSLLALDRTGCVLHLATSSKLLFPGLRVGWFAGPESALRPLAYAKQTADLHTSTLAQLLVARFITEGRLARHLAAARREYKRRRDVLADALRRLDGTGLGWSTPRGGFYFWCRLPANVTLPHLTSEAAREGVTFLPGTVFSSGASGVGTASSMAVHGSAAGGATAADARDNGAQRGTSPAGSALGAPANECIRLNFSGAAPEQLREGVKRLGRALAAAASTPSARRASDVGLQPIV